LARSAKNTLTKILFHGKSQRPIVPYQVKKPPMVGGFGVHENVRFIFW
jgi:hypothetical protein